MNALEEAPATKKVLVLEIHRNSFSDGVIHSRVGDRGRLIRINFSDAQSPGDLKAVAIQ
jgi:hypothetical protein